MIIVWRGWGIVVLPIAFVAMMLAVLIIKQMGTTAPALVGLVEVAMSGVAALAIWLLVNHIENDEDGRTFIDKNTGREFTVKPSAGSLFFIPTRYWAYIIVAIGVFAAIQATLHPGSLGKF